MSTGLAVVATSVGDIPRVVEDGVSGVLVAPKDVGALASSLERLLGDSELREHLGVHAAKRVASEYSANRTASELLTLYERIAGAA
jgi:glycosyltransferase involved in cell wall biosynthesis